MIFQNPYASLNPRMTVQELVGEGIKHHGLGGKDVDQKVEELLETVGLNKDHMSRFPMSSQVDRDSVSVLPVHFL